jgi:hypothetical protein
MTINATAPISVWKHQDQSQWFTRQNARLHRVDQDFAASINGGFVSACALVTWLQRARQPWGQRSARLLHAVP